MNMVMFFMNAELNESVFKCINVDMSDIRVLETERCSWFKVFRLQATSKRTVAFVPQAETTVSFRLNVALNFDYGFILMHEIDKENKIIKGRYLCFVLLILDI